MRKPRVFAHRGGAGEEAASTASPFRRAIDVGADVLELELELMSDDQIVVWHGKGLGNVYVGTLVLTGKSSDLRITRDAFPAAKDQLAIAGVDLPLGTAAHHAARFPYINAIGRLHATDDRCADRSADPARPREASPIATVQVSATRCGGQCEKEETEKQQAYGAPTSATLT